MKEDKSFNPYEEQHTGLLIPDAVIPSVDISSHAKLLLGILFQYMGKTGKFPFPVKI